MKYEIYADFKIADNYEVFEFTSIGKNREIQKRIEFTPTELPNIVNLAFGDVGPNNEIDDYCISDNGDRNKVLATIAYVIEIYPDRLVYFRGSTA
ncbi:MAG TPA: hypothetical protein VGM31_11200 [Puia sp.]|jgi:hypothetical protein